MRHPSLHNHWAAAPKKICIFLLPSLSRKPSHGISTKSCLSGTIFSRDAVLYHWYGFEGCSLIKIRTLKTKTAMMHRNVSNLNLNLLDAAVWIDYNSNIWIILCSFIFLCINLCTNLKSELQIYFARKKKNKKLHLLESNSGDKSGSLKLIMDLGILIETDRITWLLWAAWVSTNWVTSIALNHQHCNMNWQMSWLRPA